MRRSAFLAVLVLVITALLHLGLQVLPDALAQERGALELTILSIETENGQLPEDERLGGRMTVRSGLRTETADVEIWLRGNTSRRFPKKSYRIAVVDEEGGKKNLSIAGLRSDDDWILNPLYTDTSKIREALAYELWDVMNSSGRNAASSRMAYAELYLNGEYWGLYGVQERIDRKQVDADRRSGILYKVSRLEKPTVQELLECERQDYCGGFELEFAGAGVSRPWDAAAAYMALLSGESHELPASVDVGNLIDYGLWAMFTQAHDCHFKNQFLNCVYDTSGYTLYKIPWDLNNTFGDIWKNDSEETNHTLFSIGDFVYDGMFEVLLSLNDPQIYGQIRSRWQQLRAAVLREEALLSRAHALYDPLYDALERDTQRWPECGMGNGNALNILDIEEYIRRTLADMDVYMEQLV